METTLSKFISKDFPYSFVRRFVFRLFFPAALHFNAWEFTPRWKYNELRGERGLFDEESTVFVEDLTIFEF